MNFKETNDVIYTDEFNKLKQLLSTLKMEYPTVTIATPTFNRRPLIPFIKDVVMQQNYPHHLIEWLIIDDGTDPVQDLFHQYENNMDNIKVRYVYLNSKLSMGKKRNMLNSLAHSQIIVYMDDDDYYPPDRITHGVYSLLLHPDRFCAGSSAMNIYYVQDKIVKQWGPWHDKHSTAASLIFWKHQAKLVFNDTDCVGEETSFLNNYTIPIIQLEPKLTLMVLAHSQNSCNKQMLKLSPLMKSTKETLDTLVYNETIKTFILTKVENILDSYKEGDIHFKPDIEKATRKKQSEIITKQANQIKELEKQIAFLQRRLKCN